MAEPATITPKPPSRYDEVLDHRISEARKVLQQAQTIQSTAQDRRRLWLVLALIGVVLVVLAKAFAAWKSPSPGSVPFDRASVVSADTLGVATYAEDLIPPPPTTLAPTPRPTVSEPAPQPARSAPRRPRRPPSAVARDLAADLELLRQGTQDAGEDLLADVPLVDIPALPESDAVTLNFGSRLEAVLVGPVQTGPVGVPVTAALARDVEVGGAVAVQAGTMLVGEAFATRSDDRVQVVFRALVRDGVTVPVQALALGVDGQVGLAGAVVRKGSGTRKGLGHVLGAVGSALTLGAVGGAGPESVAADHLLGAGASRLAEFERTWSAERSDKAVRVPAGTRLVAWLQADVRIP